MVLCDVLHALRQGSEPDRAASALLWTLGGFALLAAYPCLSLLVRGASVWREWVDSRQRDARRVLTRSEIARYEGMASSADQ